MPLSPEEAIALSRQIPDWNLRWDAIAREFRFDDFEQAMDFVNKVAGVAEKQNHHPDIKVSYNKVLLELSTHEIGGLSRNDFDLAEKINELTQ
jgi:4a-hydroxytetrahydrobiopterin dehydratase